MQILESLLLIAAGLFGLACLAIFLFEPEGKLAGWAGALAQVTFAWFAFGELDLSLGGALASGALFGWLPYLSILALTEKKSGK